QTSLFCNDTQNSTLQVQHPTSGVLAFVDGQNNTWLKQNQSTKLVTFVQQMGVTRNATASAALDFSTGNFQQLTLSNGANTVTFANLRDGCECIIHLIQPSSGSGTVNWPTAAKWPGGTAPNGHGRGE